MSISHNVFIADAEWEEIDGPELLGATLRINGVFMHLEAVEVRPCATQFDADPAQGAVHSSRRHILDELISHNDGDEFQTVKINGRDYVLFACPFAK